MKLLAWLIVVLLVAVFLVPFSVYLAVKLGTYAFFRGRKLFLEEERYATEQEEEKGA